MKKIGLGIFGGIILIGLLVLLYIELTTVDTCMKDCLSDDAKYETDNLQDNKTICEDNGGIIQLYNDEGGNFSLCLFDDGSFCESWEFYRGECEKGNKKFEELLEGISESEGLTVGEEQNEAFYDGMRIKCIESGYNWIQGDCMSGENIIKIIDSDSYVDNFFDGFTGNIINGSDGKSYIITGDNTLYYNDKFGFAVILGEQWKGGKVQTKTHNEQRGENAISRSIEFHKEGFEYNVYQLTIDKIEKYDSMKKHDEFWTEDDFIKGTKGKNNKYFFIGYENDQLAPYIDTSDDLIEKMFPDGFIFYDAN